MIVINVWRQCLQVIHIIFPILVQKTNYLFKYEQDVAIKNNKQIFVFKQSVVIYTKRFSLTDCHRLVRFVGWCELGLTGVLCYRVVQQDREAADCIKSEIHNGNVKVNDRCV